MVPKVLQVQFKKPMAEATFKKMKEVVEVQQQKDGNYRIVTDGSRDLREDVFSLAVEAQNPILAMSQNTESLENIFQQITKASA